MIPPTLRLTRQETSCKIKALIRAYQRRHCGRAGNDNEKMHDSLLDQLLAKTRTDYEALSAIWTAAPISQEDFLTYLRLEQT